jgi:hypothetical protein
MLLAPPALPQLAHRLSIDGPTGIVEGSATSETSFDLPGGG